MRRLAVPAEREEVAVGPGLVDRPGEARPRQQTGEIGFEARVADERGDDVGVEEGGGGGAIGEGGALARGPAFLPELGLEDVPGPRQLPLRLPGPVRTKPTSDTEIPGKFHSAVGPTLTLAAPCVSKSDTRRPRKYLLVARSKNSGNSIPALDK